MIFSRKTSLNEIGTIYFIICLKSKAVSEMKISCKLRICNDKKIENVNKNIVSLLHVIHRVNRYIVRVKLQFQNRQ